MGYSKLWKTPFHHIIGQLRNDFGLTWLRVSIAYRRFTNVRKLFNGDLTCKLMTDIRSKFYLPKVCKCNVVSKVNGKCKFNYEFNTSCALYRYMCKCCGKVYIGQTQNTVKKREIAHIGKSKTFAFDRLKSDSFASHFGGYLLEGKSVSELKVMKTEVVTRKI